MIAEFEHLQEPAAFDSDFALGERVRLVAEVVPPGGSRELGHVNTLGREGTIAAVRPGNGTLPYLVAVAGFRPFPVSRQWIEPVPHDQTEGVA